MPRESRRLKSALNAIKAVTARRALQKVAIDLDGITAAKNRRGRKANEHALATLIRRLCSRDRPRNE
jgi:hypothetical protein